MAFVRKVVPLLGASITLATLASCGDDLTLPPAIECGPGTVQMDNQCVPTGSDTECGPGTVLMGNQCVPEGSDIECGPGTIAMGDQCVPDGSVICEQGTTFDPSTYSCEVDASVCAKGTVFVAGQCVPETDNPVADLTEAAEPNDSTGAGAFAVPALGASTTISGCVTPRGATRDLDPWIVTATEPSLLEITADGVGGLAAAFVMVDGDDNPKLDTWARVGINLSNDTSKRQVYLPTAGTYLLFVDDSRALLTGQPTGSASTCYYTTISRVPMPAASPLTVPQVAGQHNGNVAVYSFTPNAVGDIFDVTGNTTSSALVPAFVLLKNGQFYAQASYDFANDLPPFYTLGGLEPGDEITIVVDPEESLGIQPQPYTLDAYHIAAQPLPTAGSVTATKKNGTLPNATWFEQNFFYFDVATAGQILHFNLTPSVGTSMRILRHDVFTPEGAFDAVATISTSSRTSFTGQYVRFAQPGRYYFVTYHSSGTAGDTYTITSTLTPIDAAPISYGTAATGEALPAHGSAFYRLDITNQSWIQIAVADVTDWGGQARVGLYDLAGEGWLDNGYSTVQTGTQATNGSAPLERITFGDSRDFLVRVQATGTPGASPTFTLDVGDRPHAVLGPVTMGSPLSRTGMDELQGGATKGFLVLGTAGDTLHVQVTPTVSTVDISAVQRTVTGANSGSVVNAGGAGATESFMASLPAAPSYVAFTVTSLGTTPTDLDIVVSAHQPRQYTVATGALPFVDACAGGTSIMSNADDTMSAAQTLPASFGSFPLLGVPVGTQFKISSNGFLTFDTSLSTAYPGNVTIPTAAAPGAFIAPYWEDLAGITVCRKDDVAAGTVTVQWKGWIYGRTAETAELQVVLHADGVIDFIYGPNHLLDGSETPTFGTANGATVGVESQAGTFGQQLLFNMAGLTPNMSFTLTPM